MSTNFVHRDPAGFRAWSLDISEFSAVAAWLVLSSASSAKSVDVTELTQALCLASDGIWGNRVFWLIERVPRGVVALAHGSPMPSGVPRFDGLTWLSDGETTTLAPFGTSAKAICSVAEFCERFLGYRFSPGSRINPVHHR